ncbi:hypothetical protein VNI00_004234 [Paramarasmius palmivorus]|uniref:F-box domain-containing protein n=1 Tax=Paramarasmius palmivorus TaxID=297713 RepID=A0AAW0DP10_9AGAR
MPPVGLDTDSSIKALKIEIPVEFKDRKESNRVLCTMHEDTALRLPQELLDAIVEELDPSEDKLSLRQCALAARCLLPTAQRILFRTIELHNLDDTNMDHFRRLLSLSHHLALYINILELYLQCYPEFLTQIPLASIVPRLQNLQCIELLAARAEGVRPCPLTSTQFSTLLGGQEMPRIRKFVLRGDNPIEIKEVYAICEWFAERGGIQDLYFEGFYMTWDPTLSHTASPNLTTVSPIHLRRFTITECTSKVEPFLEWATSSRSCMQFTELRELTVSYLTAHTHTPVHFFRILDQAKGSLTHLRLDADMSLSSIQPYTFPELRSISCWLPNKHSALKPWCTALRQWGTPKLEKFVIQMDPAGSKHPWTFDELLDDFGRHLWNEFEEILVAHTQLESRHVVLQIQILVDTSLNHNADILQRYFPLLHASCRCQLVVKAQQEGRKGSGMTQSWEYTSRSGQWEEH